jgi:hypothetical protein
MTRTLPAQTKGETNCTATNRNGTGKVARKSLAEQIDRLDQTLDGLADNLNQAVSAAVKDAVQNVPLEVLTNPDLANLIRGAAGPAQPGALTGEQTTKPNRPGFLSRVWGKTRWAVLAACGAVGLGASQLARTALFLAEKTWGCCRHLAGLVGSGLAWLWSRVKALAQQTVALITRPAEVAWSWMRDTSWFAKDLAPLTS